MAALPEIHTRMLTRAKKKRKTGGSTQTLFSVRWARQLEWDEDEGGGLDQLETCGGTIEEARNDVESALSEFDGVNNDAGGIDQAFHDKKDAIAAQKQRIQTLIEKAREGVMNALEITQQRLSERFGDGTVVEQASVTGLGVNEVRGDINFAKAKARCQLSLKARRSPNHSTTRFTSAQTSSITLRTSFRQPNASQQKSVFGSHILLLMNTYFSPPCLSLLCDFTLRVLVHRVCLPALSSC